MLNQQTIDKLHHMRLATLAESYDEQEQNVSITTLSFTERFAMLIDRQYASNENRALQRRLNAAKLKQKNACIENVDYHASRNLKPELINQLSTCNFIRQHQHCLITGPTGTGKSYLSCALGNKACRESFKVIYFYAAKLFRDLSAAEIDGSLNKLIRRLAKHDLLIIDDWGLSQMSQGQCRNLLELIDECSEKSLIISSQYPVGSWHEIIPDPTVADAIVDRLIYNAHSIELAGESMRKLKTNSKKGGG